MIEILLPRVVCRANVEVKTVDARTGRVLRRTRQHNLVVDSGLQLMRDVIFGGAASIGYGAVGTDATAPVASDVELGNEVFRDAIGSSTKQGGVGVPYGLVMKFVVGSQSGNGNTFREAGLFNANPGGLMFARVTPEEVVKSDSILVIYTWTVTWSAA